MGTETEIKQPETSKPPSINSYLSEGSHGSPIVENSSSIAVVIVLAIVIAIVICALKKIHASVTTFLEFIVSVPWYKRTSLFFIGTLSTYLTTKVSPSYSSLPIIAGYITTFAFNEFASKKDIDKATSPLKEDIKEKENTIGVFRRIIEDKKNTFQDIIIHRINACVRITGKNDSDTLRRLKAKICDLQDIIFAEKTFTETPDEAIRRYENSISGDIDMAAQTMFGDSNDHAVAT